jgi:xanthine/uracil/vitamin C permease (AzgA family)
MFPFVLIRKVTALRDTSIAYGVIAGILSYVLLNGIAFTLRKVSRGRITPANIDASEEWVIPPGGIVPLWMYVFRSSFSVSRTQGQ